MSYKAWVATAAKQKLELQSIDAGPLGAEEVEVAVESCGLCHSDLSVLNNEWGISQFPAVLGHEVIGRVTALGSMAKGLTVGQRVGVGWNSNSCMHCKQCKSGEHNLCAQAQPTIIGHRGGFASHVRSHWAWTIPLPEKLNFADAGPLQIGLQQAAMHRRRLTIRSGESTLLLLGRAPREINSVLMVHGRSPSPNGPGP